MKQALNAGYASDGPDILSRMPIGTKVYDGSDTLLARPPYEVKTFYELTAKQGNSAVWTFLGDTDNYAGRNSYGVYDELMRKKRNSKFDLAVKYPEKRR